MHPCVCSQVTAMGNANCSFVNDTGADVHLHVYNYADGFRQIPIQSFSVKPWQWVHPQAAAHGSGLILAILAGGVWHPGRHGVSSDSDQYHKACGNGSTVKASQVLAAHNSWSDYRLKRG